jgi:hypothetical protein
VTIRANATGNQQGCIPDLPILAHLSSLKDFKLDMRSLSNRRFQPGLAEIEKCILVCANCHAELHNRNLNMDFREKVTNMEKHPLD